MKNAVKYVLPISWLCEKPSVNLIRHHGIVCILHSHKKTLTHFGNHGVICRAADRG